MNQQLTGNEQTYYEAEGDTVRERLLNALKIDLLGPETPDEALSQSPGLPLPYRNVGSARHEVVALRG